MKTLFSMSLICASLVLAAVEPVAFLSDIQGKIQIERDGKRSSVESSCEMLYAGDTLYPEKNAEAKVIYEDSMYDIKAPVSYKVQHTAVKGISAGEESEVAPVTRRIRSAYGNEEENISTLILPKTLVAATIPAITRATEEVSVYSPKGQTYSSQPDIQIKGIAGREYEATIVKDGKIIGKAVKLKASDIVSWQTFTSVKMQPDEMYELHVRFDGKQVNAPADSTFYLVDEDTCKSLDKQLTFAASMKTDNARDFFKANMLYKKECFSEARMLALKLQKKEPNNKFYQNLLNMVNKSLGYSE